MFINDLFNDKNKTLNEVSNELLGRYKKAAGADATAADKRGDVEQGNKRFKGIVSATKKQLAHDVSKHKKTDKDVVSEQPQYTPKGVPLKQPTAQAPLNIPQGWQATTQPDGSTRISKQGSMSSAEYKQNMADYKAKNWTPEKIADYGQRMASGQGYTDAERQANLQQQQQHFGKYADTGDLKETEPTTNQPRTGLSAEQRAQLRKDIDTVDYNKQQQSPAATSPERKAGIRQSVSDYNKEKVKEQDVSEEESEQESQRRRYPNYYKHKDTGTVFRVRSPDGTSRDITPDNTEEWDDYYRQQFPDLNTPNDGGFWNANNTAALVEQGMAEAEKKPHPKTWHDVDPKLGKAVDKMSQAEKVKKGLAHPDTLKKKGVAEGFLGDREYNRVLPFVKRIAGEVSDYDRDEFGEELWSLLDQKYGSKFAQSVLQDSLDFYWDTYTELTGQGLDEASVYKKDQDLSSIPTQELEAFVNKHWAGGIPTYGQGESVKRAMRELRRRQKPGVAEGSETAADIDKKIEFHKQGQAAAQYKGSMNKMHAAKIRELEAKKQALKQGVAEGGFDIPEIPRAPQPRPEPKNKAVGEGSGRNRGYEPGFASPHAPSLGGRRDRDEPDAVNNIEISINGRVWKIFAGKGPDSSKEFFQQKQAVDSMCKRKTAETGKKWSWGVTGAAATNEGTKCNMTEQGRACPDHGIMECPGYSRLMGEAFKMPPESVQDKLHKRHQELRKKSGLPDPEHYLKLKKQKEQELVALRAEIAADKEKGLTEERYLEELQRAGYDVITEKKIRQRLDPSCWKGYKKQGTKIKGGVRVNNCVPKE